MTHRQLARLRRLDTIKLRIIGRLHAGERGVTNMVTHAEAGVERFFDAISRLAEDWA